MFAKVNSVAFVDDDKSVRLANCQSLELAGLEVRQFQTASEALKHVGRGFPGVVVSDMRMPEMDGRAFFQRLKEVDDELPVIFITGHANINDAVEAIHKGAYDYLQKPYAADHLVRSVRRALEARQLVLDDRELAASGQGSVGLETLIGESAAMQKLRADIRTVAETDVAILLEGETGVGKEVVARLIHRNGRRRSHPFVPIDFAAIPESCIESELFGHEAGAFSAGGRRRIGRIEAADRGTMFLDEIESLPLAAQGRLLRVLEEREYTPLGTHESRGVDARIIAATKECLSDLVGRGAFRRDLFYRLNIVHLQIPPLRERREDVPLLFNAFLVQAAERFGTARPTLTDAVRRHLLEHHWPGNVRELQHYADNVALGMNKQAIAESATELSLQQRVDQFEAQIICDALSQYAGDVRSTIAALSMPRKTFYDKLKRHRIDIAKFRPSRG